jgi:hypothetical protein
MTKTRMAALMAASAFLVLASVPPASAAVIFSLTGVVGDANWQQADPQIVGLGSYAWFGPALYPYFQSSGGPGGPISVTYNGPGLELNLSQIYSDSDSWLAQCDDPSGCVNGNGFDEFDIGSGVAFREDYGSTTASFTDVVDANYYGPYFDLPASAPYGALIPGTQSGNVNYFLYFIVGPDGAGQPFSITISTVPEPATWAMFLIGFGAIGWTLRSARAALSPHDF